MAAVGTSVGPIQKGPGAQNRKFKTKKPGSRSEAPVYAVRTDLTSLLWQAEKGIEKCPECKKSFGFFRRMHHCRSCGIIYCDNDCSENDEHDGERVCVNCLRSLKEVNDWAKQEFAERIRRAQEAKALLEELKAFKIVDTSRQKIIDEEIEARLYLLDSMRETRRSIAADIRNDAAKFLESGNGAHVEKRRTRPIYGKRGGILRLRVKKVRNIPQVKPVMTCYPHVVVEVGSKREFTAPANIDFTRLFDDLSKQKQQQHNQHRDDPFALGDGGDNSFLAATSQADFLSKISHTNNTTKATDNNISNPTSAGASDGNVLLDHHHPSPGNHHNHSHHHHSPSSAVINEYTYDELFVFHVDDDRKGVLISIVDDFSMIDVPVLLGIAYLNLRKMNVVEDEADWTVYEKHLRDLERKKNPQQHHDQQQQHQHDYYNDYYDQYQYFGGTSYEEEEARIRRKMRLVDEVLLPGGEFLDGVKHAEPIRLSKAASTLLKMKYVRRNGVVMSKKERDADGKKNKNGDGEDEPNHEASDENLAAAVASSYVFDEGEDDDEDENAVEDEHVAFGGIEGMEHHRHNNHNNHHNEQELQEVHKKGGGEEDKNRKKKKEEEEKKKVNENDEEDDDEEEDAAQLIASLMKHKSKNHFSRNMERGTATRALCDFSGHALTSAQISLSWSFHPYKVTARQRKRQGVEVCPGCGEIDLPSECLCADQEKEDDDEDYIKHRLRQVGGEMHAIEMKSRSKYALAHDAAFAEHKRESNSTTNNNNGASSGVNVLDSAVDSNDAISSPLIARKLQQKRIQSIVNEEEEWMERRKQKQQHQQEDNQQQQPRTTSAVLASYKRRHQPGAVSHDVKKEENKNEEHGEDGGEQHHDDKKKKSSKTTVEPIDFGPTPIPILKKQNKDHIETCCC